ncbi:hypothetical protein [Lysinibacillus sp. FSL K6-3209]|uniref:hypothetical protein n=1 Tax=Lysinibacillus sp. FSL K6-3209 TaxID=2921497 RepID=UPI0030D8A956
MAKLFQLPLFKFNFPYGDGGSLFILYKRLQGKLYCTQAKCERCDRQLRLRQGVIAKGIVSAI